MIRRPLGAVAMGVVIAMMAWLALFSSLPGAGGQAELPDEGDLLMLTGRVCRAETRQIYETSQLWIYLDSITIQSINASDVEADISYQMICITDTGNRPPIGSRIRITGQFEPFSHSNNPGQFDPAQYYETLGIGGRLKNAEIIGISEEYSVVKEKLYRLREHWKERLFQCFPEKEASILCAMLLGEKAGVDSGIKELYQQNGIIHILSISGLHITLIGMSIYRLLRRMGCPVAAAAAVGGVLLVLYGIMTGMGVSAVRAIGMYLIRMLGEILGRTYDMLTALGVMALVMLAERPQYLNNGGFLLSFGSICGIGLVLPRLQDDSKRNPVKKAILPGVSITLFTLPIQLKLYYEIPVYSVFLNLLVLPFMSMVMVVGMAVMIIPGVQWVGLPDILILKGYEWLCTFFGSLPGHTWNPGAPDTWQIIGYYGLLFLALYVKKIPWPGKIYHAGKAAHEKQASLAVRSSVQVGSSRQVGSFLRIGRYALIITAIWVLSVRIPQELTVIFLDVGQGDCICVRTKKETYLFDCGSSSERKVAENILIPYLKHEGISRLDGVFVSHPDNDHISGILELLETGRKEGITTDRLILPDIGAVRIEEEMGELLQAAEQSAGGRIPVSYMGAGTVWQSGKVSFQCMHPTEDSGSLDSNAYSMCFLIAYDEFSMLLTGDMEGSGESRLQEELIKNDVENISLLKVAHHGSRNSTSEELLRLLDPIAAVISCGKENSYGHPHEELLERLEKTGTIIYMTPQTGAVTMRISGGKWKVKTYAAVQISGLEEEKHMLACCFSCLHCRG